MIDPKYLKNLTPPRKLLDQCHQVLLADPDDPVWRMKRWARKHCQSFVWAELVDTSDVSYEYDSVTAFYFGTESDKLMFMMKYKH
jgi:hypothetical protein